MHIVCIGGGPAGLFLSILLKKADPSHRIEVYERNRAHDTFGFGVVFSDQTLGNLEAADPETLAEIRSNFSYWDEIDVHIGGELHRSGGHGFCGLSRQKLLDILHRRAEALGVELHFETEVSDFEALRAADLVVGADGVNSLLRRTFASGFGPRLKQGTNRFIWLGTTRRFPAFTFYFRENEHGLWRVHAYNYDEGSSTFIVECTEETWRRAGLTETTEEENAAYVAELFAEELEGHPLLTNRSIWRSFPDVAVANWFHDNMVLLGDAVHTAHFSVGSGTKLAMEGSIALAEALTKHQVQAGDRAGLKAALQAYVEARRPEVESLQRAARVSEDWFTHTERYFGRLEPAQFAFSLLTRSLRITYSNLELRDEDTIRTMARWVAERAAEQSGQEVPLDVPPPPMFTPFRLRDLVIPNRMMVSPMCQYSAEDGTPGDWHMVHLGSRAVGGAGLIMTEMTDVSRRARISPGCTGMYKPEHVAAWRRIVDFVHASGPSKIGIQLGHAGRKASTRLLWEGIDQPLEEGNWPIVAPSPLPYLPNSQVPTPIDRAEMDVVRDEFVRATRMADEAGFDLVELHMAHGYLLGSFLSPVTNQREDDYGGSRSKRMRYPLEVFSAMRAAWPAHKPMSVRVSATDWMEGGVTPEDTVELARELAALGCDIIDVSSGQTDPAEQPVYGRLFQTPFAEQVRLEAGLPTITVGNISSYADANTIIAAGRADICAVARAHLFDPYWTRHAAYEQGVDLPWPDPYSSINNYRPRMEWSPRATEGR